jgi:hypothetical protein
MCTWEQITDAILRHTNTSLGAVLATAGVAADNTLSTVIGAAVALISVGQSILDKLRARAERVQVVTSDFLETTGGPAAERLEVQTTDLPRAKDAKDAKDAKASDMQPPASGIGSKVGVGLLVFGVCAFGAGCASHKSTVLERTDKNGETTRLTRSATRTLFDADTKLANNVVLQSSNSQSIAIGSLRQQSSGSNAVQSLRIMLEMMEKLQGLP